MKKTLLSGIAALLLATGAAHAAWKLPMDTQAKVLPPKEFDHPFDGRTELSRVTQAEINRICPNPGQRKYACGGLRPDGICVVWIVDDDGLDLSGYDYDVILRHEIGHCNGWHH